MEIQRLKIDFTNTQAFINAQELNDFGQRIAGIQQNMEALDCAGSEFLGWQHLPSQTPDAMLDDLVATAQKLRAKSEFFVVIGIGGSYLGARAIVDALNNPFAAYHSDAGPRILYAGNNLSEDYHYRMLKLLDKHDYSVAVISKSGTTTEPAVAFRLLKQHLENKYGKAEAAQRIVAITDESKGALRTLASQEGYKTYVIPDNVGGRYSVLTPVGLLPIAVAGFDIKALMQGARFMEQDCLPQNGVENNLAAQYAIYRNALHTQGFDKEILINFNPALVYFTEWWKQLYGESEGKEHKGIFPAGANFTTDLHSMGQYIQEGPRRLFETLISVEKSKHQLGIPKDDSDLDGLNYLQGSNIEYVNQMAETGTVLAHLDGGVPIIKVMMERLNEVNLGQLIYFFELACAYSGYLLEVNPFDQPGVEAYKKNMFALLGKPGNETETQKIRARLNI